MESDIISTIIENYWVKVKILSTKYGPRNLDEENDLV